MVRGGISRFLLFIVLILIISSFAVLAVNETTSLTDQPQQGFDLSLSYKWLDSKVNNVTIGTDQRALSTIALIQGYTGSMDGFVQILRDTEDKTGACWPSGGCKVKDSALAALTLGLMGQDVTKEIAWLKAAKVPSLNSGEWEFVIKSSTNANGTCQFNYLQTSKSFVMQDDKVKFDKGKFTPGQYYVSLNDLNPTLKNTLQPVVVISCETSLNPIVTLIYKPSVNTFFIQRSDPGSNLQLKLANACFGRQVPATSCDFESTAYATWTLLELNALTNDPDLTLENIGTHIYLENQVISKNNDPVSLALLNRILIKAGSAAPSFISQLVKLQKPTDGSWGDITTTAISTFSLTGSDKTEEVAKGITYLTSKVEKPNGGWGTVESTSWALIALHGGELSKVIVNGGSTPVSSTTEICNNDLDDNGNGVIDCAESVCLNGPECACANNVKDPGEEGVDCGGSCPTACENLDLNVAAPSPDQTPVEQPSEPAPADASTSNGSLWWLWVLILLILIGGGIFFYVKYVKTGKVDLGALFGKKKPKGPSFEEFRRQAEFKPIQQTQRPQTPIRGGPAKPMQPARPAMGMKSKSKEEEELEKSMREAEKLLKG